MDMMYDEFSSDYDRFVNWPARLGVELPFIEGQLQQAGAHRVLDAACGTGKHAIALAQKGYSAAGADLSAGMIEQAQANAAAAGVQSGFFVAGFGELSTQVGGGFDALLCLGNSLPHVLTPPALSAALGDFAACLRPGGLLLVQNRNFDAVLARHERWMEPQSHRQGDKEWLFLRFYDFQPDGLLSFHVLTLRRQGSGEWSQRVTSTQLWPQRRDELVAAVGAAGFVDVTCYGDMQGQPYDAASSGNLVITARRVGLGHGRP
jgi:glycine/sarcosine N-methyltransferase